MLEGYGSSGHFACLVEPSGSTSYANQFCPLNSTVSGTLLSGAIDLLADEMESVLVQQAKDSFYAFVTEVRDFLKLLAS